MAGKVAGMYPRTPEMRESYAKANEALMRTIVREYGEEIDSLLRATDKHYEERIYIKPVYWLGDLKDHPEKYPLLAEMTPLMQKRAISLFLKGQGRVSRGGKNRSKTNVWMLPEAVSEPA